MRPAVAQPKRLALLAYLAIASPLRAHRRDSLLALLWPDSDTEQARHALRQALHYLRRALGPAALVSRGDGDVTFNPAALWCDAHAFERAFEAGDFEQALQLYRGDLLAGFFVSDVSPDFERWVDAERARFRSRAARAAWSLAETAERRGDRALAAECARRACELSPDDEGAVRRLITLLLALGDHAAALRAYDAFARRLAAEFEAEPSAETQALLAAVRAPRPPRAVSGPAIASSPLPPEESRPAAPPPLPRRGRRAAWLAALTVAAGLGITVVWRSLGSAAPRTPVIAVGQIDDRAADTAGMASVLRELIATDLARVPDLHVVSHGRLLELLGQLGSEETPAAMLDAIRRSGADERLEGALYRRAPAWRLDLRRVDVKSGVVRAAYSAEGADVFALAERATAGLARDLALPAPATPLGEVTTPSLVARRLFEEGLRAYYLRANLRAAYPLFSAALAEDSSFAMAAYYAHLSAPDLTTAAAHLEHAVRATSRSSERERLIIRLGWAIAANDPSYLALAESLAARHPTEPAGALALGTALFSRGDFLAAVPHLRGVIASDSLGLRGQTPLCRACEAFSTLIGVYLSADSFAAAERTAREWVRLQPASSQAWQLQATVAGELGRRRDADSLLLRAAELQPELATLATGPASFAIQADEYPEADRILLDRLRHGTAEVREDALWWLLISRRNQGRLKAALPLARELAVARPGQPPSQISSLARAQVLFEMGRFPEAAALFDSLARLQPVAPRLGPGQLARHRVWMLTHVATALAASRDTQRLGPIADSIENLARNSGYGRDHKLPHHVRGLLWLRRGEPRRAAEEFRRAIFSPTHGYTRTNLERGRLLLSFGEAREAIRVIRPALRGNTEAMNFYVTRVELHELLAQAFEAAAEPDSAATHYRVVVAAWQNGDPAFQERARSARHHLALLRQAGSFR